MLDYYDAIYLAPHSDDVALSCGGQLFQRSQKGHKLLVVTVTVGDLPEGDLPPFATAHHQKWGVGRDVAAIRRAEDEAACQILGADYHPLTIMDCIYRRDPDTGKPLYETDSGIFGPPSPKEAYLIDVLTEIFGALPACGQLFVPMSIGCHVDHQLTRAAAERLFDLTFSNTLAASHPPKKEIVYYEDYPYVQWEWSRSRCDDRGAGWHMQVVPLNRLGLAKRIEAIAAYNSQLHHLFENYDDMASRVTDYSNLVGGERIWRKKSGLHSI